MADPETRPDDVAVGLAALGSATLGESGGQAAHRRLRPVWRGASIAAPAGVCAARPRSPLIVVTQPTSV